MTRTTCLLAAVEDALRAPSVHNTQPWQWRILPDGVELHADWNRHLIATDPDRRDLVLSCGAALHHLEVALAGRGLAVQVRRMPDRADRGHLATVAARLGSHDVADAAQFPAIGRWHTDRRQMSDRPVADDHLRSLAEHARRTGALLLPVADAAMCTRLTAALTNAAHRQEIPPMYVADLHGTGDDASVLLVVATMHDDPLDWLHAGEATSAVLLAATALGLATTPLSQALEVEATRREIRQDVLQVPEHPQLIIRVGWPATTAAELPVTRRRTLRSVLLPG